MGSELFFRILKLRERLWVKPLLYCGGAVIAIWLARMGNVFPRPDFLSLVTADMIEMLLKIISSSMLAVATFAVGSLVSAYASASAHGTPRAFQLLIADDTSQNALSSFIGAFIFSVVALIALKLDFYTGGGLVALFALTLAIFSWVVLTFVNWTDKIARLGRLNTIISKTEDMTAAELRERADLPYCGGLPATAETAQNGAVIRAEEIGYIQHIDYGALQQLAEDHNQTLEVIAQPGQFMRPDRTLVVLSENTCAEKLEDGVRSAILIGPERNLADDPRLGFVILSEVASRALSPAVNDPGTAIVIIGRIIRLLALRSPPEHAKSPSYDRLYVHTPTTDDMITDAFRAMSRDGAGNVEVMICLQKALVSLASCGDGMYRDAARRMAQQAFARAQKAMVHEFDIDAVREAGAPLLDD